MDNHLKIFVQEKKAKELGIDDLLNQFIKKRLEYFGYTDIQFIDGLDEIKNCQSEYAVLINSFNPFIDIELLNKMFFYFKKYSQYALCKSQGAVPGTEIDFIVRTEKLKNKKIEGLKCLVIPHETQLKFNCQLNLFKQKRLKIFKNLVQLIPNIEKLTIQELMQKLKEPEVFKKIISYFEDIRLIFLDKCPYCQGALQPIRATVSQPMLGYLPDVLAYYFKCIHCQLIVLSPHAAADESYKLYDKYYQEGKSKDYSFENESFREDYQLGLEMIQSLMPKNVKCIDLGSGSGVFVKYLKKKEPRWQVIASDFPETLKYFELNEEIEAKPLNILKDVIGKDEYDLITAWEVIEHLPFSGFKELLTKIYDALSPSGVFLFSTPDFDSPLSQAWDSYNLYAPHHMVVYSRTWFNDYFSNNSMFELLGIKNNSAVFNNYDSWFSYWQSTSKNHESCVLAQFFGEALKNAQLQEHLKEFVSKKNYGSGMIVALQKKQNSD